MYDLKKKRIIVDALYDEINDDEENNLIIGDNYLDCLELSYVSTYYDYDGKKLWSDQHKFGMAGSE